MKFSFWLCITLTTALTVSGTLAAPVKQPVPAKSATPKTQTQVRSTGFFSDMAISRQSGDIVGTEIFFFVADKHYALVLVGEGQLQEPQLVEAVVSGNSVQFKMQRSGDERLFSGTFSPTGLSGTFGNGDTFKLPRKKPLFFKANSTLSMSRGSGDALGLELVTFLADTEYVLMLEGAGDFLPPRLAKVVDDYGRIKFSTKNGDGSPLEFRGQRSKTGIQGTFDSPLGNVRLPVKKSFWE